MINQIFALLNFLVLIGFCVYVFRKYAAEPLRAFITMDQVTLSNMQRKYEQLFKQEQSLVRVGLHQHETYHELSHKIAVWSTVLHRQHTAGMQERLVMKKRIEERLLMQKTYLEQQIICREVLPQAVQQATAQLMHQFKTPKQHREYIKHVLHKLPSAVKNE